MTAGRPQDPKPQDLLENHIEPFLKELRASGYAERTLRKKRSVVRSFIRWTKRKCITADDLSDYHVAAFLARSPQRRKAHVKFQRAVLRLFFHYLRSSTGLLGPSLQEVVSEVDGLVGRYADYLRTDPDSRRTPFVSMCLSFVICSAPTPAKRVAWPRRYLIHRPSATSSSVKPVIGRLSMPGFWRRRCGHFFASSFYPPVPRPLSFDFPGCADTAKSLRQHFCYLRR